MLVLVVVAAALQLDVDSQLVLQHTELDVAADMVDVIAGHVWVRGAKPVASLLMLALLVVKWVLVLVQRDQVKEFFAPVEFVLSDDLAL